MLEITPSPKRRSNNQKSPQNSPPQKHRNDINIDLLPLFTPDHPTKPPSDSPQPITQLNFSPKYLKSPKIDLPSHSVFPPHPSTILTTKSPTCSKAQGRSSSKKPSWASWRGRACA